MLFNVIGWTIIHSLWQCLGLFCVLKMLLALTDLRRSAVRYATALGVSGLTVIVVSATFFWEWERFATSKGGEAIVVVVQAGGTEDGILGLLAKCFPYLSVAWMVGFAWYLGRLVLSGIGLKKLRGSEGVPDEAAEAMLEALRGRMDIVRPVRLLITARVIEPMVFGIWRSVVVLPLEYLGAVPAAQLELILAHELAHIRRHDYLVNLVQSGFDALLFFNPFFRMVSAIVREEREYCCDDQAARAGGGERMMAVALTNLGLVKRGLALGLSVVPSKRGFYRRVIRLIEPAERPELPVRGLLLGLFGATALVVLLTQCSRNGATPDSLPVAGDRLMQVLTDNQAGYKEQVFNYTKGGKEHEIFLVRTVDERQALYAYLDGKRLNPEELSTVMKVVRVRPTVDIVLTEASTFRRDTPAKSQQDMIKDEVKTAMARYSRDIAMIPLGVEQHRILTRIITSNQYTETDQREVSELIRKRQAMNLSAKEPPPPPPAPSH